MSRWSAAGIHLLITIGVLSVLSALMLSTWYARGLFQFAQADKLLLIIGAVDLVVGPLLTLFVFKPGKKGLKFDLCMIGFAQAAFLAYGLSVAWVSRPAFLVGLEGRVQLVFANEVSLEALPDAHPSLEVQVPWLGPELVGTRPPTDARLRQWLFEELFRGRDLPVFPQFYLPFEQVAADLLAGSDSIESLGTRLPDAERRELHDSLRAEFGDDARWVPIASSRGVATLFIDPADARPLRAVPVDPR